MAAGDLTINEANVQLSTKGADNTTVVPVLLGETVGKSVPVYKDINGKYKAADCTDAAKAVVEGITLTGGDLDEQVMILKSGVTFEPGASLTIGAYYLSSASGKIMPGSSLVTTNKITQLGTAVSITRFRVNIDNTGEEVP